MKIAIASDIHLEFGDLSVRNTENADVLILAGDICVVKDFRTRDSQNKYAHRCHAFFDQVSQEFPHVLYILGNHEHYGNDMAYTLRNLQDRLADRKNIQVIERQCVEISGVTFAGTTLWTNLNNRNPQIMWEIAPMLADFVKIKMDVRHNMIHNDPPRITPDIWCDEYDRCKRFLDHKIQEKKTRTVVVTHFSPSYMSCHEKWRHDHVINAGFHTELYDFIYDNPHIKLWVHGHTHDDFDYTINDTRVVCNPRGYVKYETRAAEWQLKYVEI